MWQRKQTVFLALAAISLILMIFFPVWIATTGSEVEVKSHLLFPLHYTIKEKATGVSPPSPITTYFPYAISAILAIAAATIAIFEIGKFENRLLQIKLGAINSLLMAGAMGSAVYFAIQLIKTTQVAGEYGFALYLPGVAMVCNLIANRFIRKDERLVRDAERLR